jgi:DeoR/GlpR family transcriptional regulator of sugar metabolism
MNPERRRAEIVSLLRAMQTELHVDELARILQVSELTVRRDLEQLAEQSLVIRTHGGCIAAGKTALETDYHRKVAHNFQLKEAIGRAAAAEVNAGDTLLLTDGSTTFHLAAQLEGRGPLTVYTNSLAMITDLARCRDMSLYILGGKYNGTLYSLQGSLTEQLLESLQFDICFIGADAVTAEGQCMVVTPEEASLTRAMMRRARRRILMADHTKCDSTGYFAYASLSDFNLWITTPGIDSERLAAYRGTVEVKEAIN